MDILFFLKHRTNFIRQLYDTTSAPYVERQRKIEAREEPFVPPYSENEEPAFLGEWLEADESLHVLAYSCISMLATALHLYFETWIRQSNLPIEESMKKSIFKKCGWLVGYKTHFERHFKIDFSAGPTALELLEELVLARNRIEHPASITNNRTQYATADLQKLRLPFFVDEREAALFSDTNESENTWLFSPTLHVSEEQLFTTISGVVRFAEWFEVEIEKRVYAPFGANI